MSVNSEKIRTNAEYEYQMALKNWRDIQKEFDFCRKSIHNIHLTSVIDNMATIVRRLQLLAYIQEKWDDN